MAGFYDKLKAELDKATKRTENGAVGFETSGSALVDMNWKVTGYRTKPENDIVNDFLKAFSENPELATKWMFYAGDVREGLGERRLFRTLVKHVIPLFPHLIPQIGVYSRFDILSELFGTTAEQEMLTYVQKTLLEDINNMKAGKSVSLLAKWLPSVNTSSKAARQLALKYIKAMKISPAEYRKMLSGLRKYIGVIEQKICAKEWADIDYEKVPSKANLKYKNAFLRNDEARRREFLGKLVKGEAKIHSAACFPHDIIASYGLTRWGNKNGPVDAALEGMWKGLPARDASAKPVIVVRDGSGSMDRGISGTNATPLDIATALAIYFSEHCSPEYKDKFITFSSSPKFVDLSNLTTLRDKIVRAVQEAECSNTNIEKVFELILQTARHAHLDQKEIPEVLIISDMEFDCATTHRPNQTLFGKIAQDWKNAGYTLPGITFWNVCGRTNTVPMQTNPSGVKLVSGFSQNAIEIVMNDAKGPFEALKKVLLGDRYAPITIK